ncbi:MAG TPA: flagellar biosynthetic protein FliO [Tepidisphaeraceae bacterium]|nr:flagellar biosynthetic protein FliO [Tepidisphaeraceae bacterium]
MKLKGMAVAWLALAVACAMAMAQNLPASASDEHRPILRSGPDSLDAAATAGGAKNSSPSAGFDSAWVLICLCGVIGLIFLLRWVSRGIMNPGGRFRSGGQAVKVLGRCFIAPRQQVLLLQVGRRIVVVGDSGGQLSSLAQISEADEVAELIGQIRTQASPLVRGNPFAALFGKAKEPYESAESEESAIAAPSPANSDVAPTSDGIESTRSAIHDLMERVRGLREKLER